MDPIVKWLGTEQMARLLVPDKKVKVIGRNDTLKLRDEDCFPYDFSPVDLVTKWNEEVRVKIPANWGWILAKLQKTAPGIVVNSTLWESDPTSGRMVATGHIYHWDPTRQTCTCPAFRKSAINAELLGAMGVAPWCKHLTLLDPLVPHFAHPLGDPHGFINFVATGGTGGFMNVDSVFVHSLVQMHVNNDYWEYPQTFEGHKLLFDRLVNAHAKGFQIRNLIEVRG